ncbi:MAG TPA: DNA polymerase/3'-5' exonuclease PolX [Armatimonadota bacterium]|nr:DNA polymerase/3'-5' exonuclease PolX [Armatimonadota bacterium]
MKNKEVAGILGKIADLYEIKGGESFRVRAYRSAIAQIENMGEDIEDVAARGELESIPGVGKATAEKVRDILETGTTPRFEELKSRIPETLTDLLKIPDIGPSTVRMLWQRLGITSMDDLAQAAKDHRIRDETSFGEKGEAQILRNMEMLREHGHRLSLGVVLPMAEDVIARLKETGLVKQISEGGSLRRRKDTIGDIDIVAETSDPKALSEAFTRLPQVQQVIESGATMTSVLTKSGLRMDIRIAEPGHFGAMLHHFTGSKYHNIHLRGMARDMGLTMNDYGMHRIDTSETVVPGKDEEEIYRVLGLPLIPVELREDRGEIEAAKEGRLPKLIEPDDIKGDLHVHTSASDGKNSLEEMVEAAQARGYRYLAICDHTITHGVTEERLLAQIEDIKRLNRRLKSFRVLAGAEVDIRRDGSLELDSRLLDKLDIVVGSVHQRYKMDEHQMTERIVKAIETGWIDILAHPTGRLINRREPYEVNFDRVLDAAKAHSTALEMNTYPDRLDLNDIYARMAKEHGVKLAIDSDAHATGELATLRYGVMLARRGWLQPGDVLNTMPVDDLLDWLEKRRSRLLVPA